MEKGKVYFGGIPTEPDVNKLMDKFPVNMLNPGFEITYEEVAKVIDEKIGSSRWRSVTNAWRNKMESKYNKYVSCSSRKSDGGDETYGVFVVLTEGGKVQLGGKKVKSAARAARKAVRVLTNVSYKALKDEEKRDYDLSLARAGAIITAAQVRSGKSLLPTMDDT